MGGKPRVKAQRKKCLCCEDPLCQEHPHCRQLALIGLCVECVRGGRIERQMGTLAQTIDSEAHQRECEQRRYEVRKDMLIKQHDDLDDAYKRARESGFLTTKIRPYKRPPKHLPGCRYSPYPWDAWHLETACKALKDACRCKGAST